MRTMDGDVSGHAEPGFHDYTPDDVVQFERVGFARVDSVPGDAAEEHVAYYTHP
jgi:glutamyl-tRNA synthetase